MSLLQTLVARGVLKEADEGRAADAVATATGHPPHLTLIEKGFVKEDALLPVLAEEFGLDFVDLTQATVEPDALKDVPLKLISRKNLMPLARQNGTLVVATGDPFDAYALDELQTLTGLHVRPVLGSAREITRLRDFHFGRGADTISSLVKERAEDGIELLEELEADDSELAKQAQEASVVKLVNEILVE